MSKKFKRILASILVLTLMLGVLAGCTTNEAPSEGEEGESSTETPTGGDEILYIFNTKGENAQEFEEMTKAFSEETGITVEAFSVGAGTDKTEPLRAQMSSKNPPAIFSIEGLKELPEWVESGSVLDLATLEAGELKDIADQIPTGLRLSPDGEKNYGIPYNVEGYGYIVDSKMLGDLFGEESVEGVLADLRTSSYEEFTAFVLGVEKYIETPSAAKITLMGNEYTFNEAKTGLAENLTGVFAFAGAEKWTYGDHTVNVALNAVLESPEKAQNITDAQFEELRPVFVEYAKTLDFVSSHVGGMDEPAKRGPDLVSASKHGYDQSVQAFADGNALFLQQGNWVATNIAKVSEEVSTRVSFIPVKMPITAGQIKTGKTLEGFQSSIPVFVPNFYVINSKASAEAQEHAKAFLVWMNKPENVQKYVIDSFKFIPYNSDSSMTIDDALSSSIMSYLEEGMTLAAPYHGAPGPWSGDTLGKEIMENYLTKETWTEADYDAIADYAITAWKDLKE